MKLLFFVSCLFFFFGVCQCKGETSTTPFADPTPVKLLVLLDKSASIKFTKDQTEKLPEDLNRLLGTAVGNNSTIGLYFINSVAMSKAYYKSIIQLKEPDLNGGGQDIAREKRQFNQNLLTARGTWKKKIKEALAIKATGSTTAETDIWGCLSGIESFFYGQAKKKLYIYSDMIHSTKSLDHHNLPPKDEQKAREQARSQLAAMVKKYNLKKGSLSGIEVNVIFPGNAVSANKNKIMEAYWKTVFESLGAKTIVFE